VDGKGVGRQARRRASSAERGAGWEWMQGRRNGQPWIDLEAMAGGAGRSQRSTAAAPALPSGPGDAPPRCRPFSLVDLGRGIRERGLDGRSVGRPEALKRTRSKGGRGAFLRGASLGGQDMVFVGLARVFRSVRVVRRRPCGGRSSRRSGGGLTRERRGGSDGGDGRGEQQQQQQRRRQLSLLPPCARLRDALRPP
jgi:hypothetical protein